ncbi:molecular chaperone SurA [Aureimonas sp. Leaf454]|uniref:SurA N-terminal domain-containing protein n=1 Tax=Aureimonas sp. Leaf454 TaxID=1736381 RepID=UPI0006F90927|nr:SurA N-terminal domain-containing protein [Aureimonas sp. Leaf454]KQT50795.1 molecular chaperone SurA [Aureimonas sp. Leaf454]
MPIARNLLLRPALALILVASGAASAGLVGATPALAASEITVIVNKEPITTFQVRQRSAFLKLRRVSGNLQQQATDELIDEALKRQETKRRGISIPDAMVEQAFQKFAGDNKLTTQQLGQVLTQAGFSEKAFKDYIRVQMGWGQAVQANMRKSETMSEQDVVQRMLKEGGNKPSTTEYTLQQVIFVVPEAKRKAMVGQRMKEANAMRQRFQSCPATYDLAKGLRDVTVRELGRVPQPALPERWKDPIIKAGKGTTPAQETERGVEYLAICETRSVSDDKVAAMVFQTQDMEKLGKSGDGPDAKLLKQLKDKAAIIRR